MNEGKFKSYFLEDKKKEEKLQQLDNNLKTKFQDIRYNMKDGTLQEIIKQAKIDITFWSLCIERKVLVEKAEKEIDLVLKDLRKYLTINQIYRLVVAWLPVDYQNSRFTSVGK